MTGAVSSNMIETQKAKTQISLPRGSIYEPAREAVESAMRNDKMADVGMPAQQWVPFSEHMFKPPNLAFDPFSYKTCLRGQYEQN